MNQALVDQIVNAVLYEGYIIYPYRPSVKNRRRWTFGALYPRSFSEAQEGSDACVMQTECLVEGNGQTQLQVSVRFLHLLNRQVGRLEPGVRELSDGTEPPFHIVEQLQVGERLLQTWQEAEEREHSLSDLALVSLVTAPWRREFALPARRWLEPVRGPLGDFAAILVREQQAIRGAFEVSARPVADGLFKLTARIENRTPFELPDERTRDEAQLRALMSTHLVLGVVNGAFVSMIDPPEEWRAAAGDCRNLGTWPVLVGSAGQRDTLLSSPIILYDYPQIAPESPGDLFDGTEIDEILTLRILTLTDDEKQAMAALDERARALLQRTEALGPEQMSRLHGAVRGLRAVGAGGPP